MVGGGGQGIHAGVTLVAPRTGPDTEDVSMKDIDQIRNLIFEYYHLMDLGDYAGVAALYGTEGVMRGLDWDGTEMNAWTGKDEILGLWTALVRTYDGIPKTKHCITNLVVDVDEDAGTAEGRSYYMVYQATDDFPLQVITAGRWYDTLMRDDGRWRFVERKCFSDLVGDFRAHLRPEALQEWWEEGAEAAEAAASA